SYEIIVYAFDSDNYTRSLFHTVELIQQKPADPFLIAYIGKILNSSFAAQKSHQLGKYIELPSPDYRESYNMILQFFQNLNVEDFASISYHFLKQYETQLKTSELFKSLNNKNPLKENLYEQKSLDCHSPLCRFTYACTGKAEHRQSLCCLSAQ